MCLYLTGISCTGMIQHTWSSRCLKAFYSEQNEKWLHPRQWPLYWPLWKCIPETPFNWMFMCWSSPSPSLCSGKQMQRSLLGAALASKLAPLRYVFLVRINQWRSLCLWSWWREKGTSALGRSVQGLIFSVRLRRASKPLVTQRRGRGGGGVGGGGGGGGMSRASSIDCRERDGTERQRCGWEEWVCVHEWVCMDEKEKKKARLAMHDGYGPLVSA